MVKQMIGMKTPTCMDATWGRICVTQDRTKSVACSEHVTLAVSVGWLSKPTDFWKIGRFSVEVGINR
jgi:hypothetical protein